MLLVVLTQAVGCEDWKLVGRSISLHGFPSNLLLASYFSQGYETSVNFWNMQAVKVLLTVIMTVKFKLENEIIMQKKVHAASMG